MYIRQRGIPIPSPKGINIIAQGKAVSAATLGQITSVIPTLKGSNKCAHIAPFQGADGWLAFTWGYARFTHSPQAIIVVAFSDPAILRFWRDIASQQVTEIGLWPAILRRVHSRVSRQIATSFRTWSRFANLPEGVLTSFEKLRFIRKPFEPFVHRAAGMMLLSGSRYIQQPISGPWSQMSLSHSHAAIVAPSLALRGLCSKSSLLLVFQPSQKREYLAVNSPRCEYGPQRHRSHAARRPALLISYGSNNGIAAPGYFH